MKQTVIILAMGLAALLRAGAAPEQQAQAEAYFQRALAVHKVDAEASLGLFMKAARLGHVNAMLRMAHTNQHRKNPNLKEALKWYAKAADAGSTAAMHEIGAILETERKRVPADYAGAIEWYEKGAAAKSVKCYAALARLRACCPDPAFHDGPAALKIATALTRLDKQNPEYFDLLAAAHARNHDFLNAQKAESQAMALSELNDAPARRRLRDEYAAGRPHPPVASEEWILTAADRDNAWAMMKLSRRYGDEFGGHYDPAMARLWRERAAEAGQMEAMLALGHMCYRGEGGEVDYKKAFWCFNEAAKAKIPAAYAPLARMYAGGKGVSENLGKAIEWFDLSKKSYLKTGWLEYNALTKLEKETKNKEPISNLSAKELCLQARALARQKDLVNSKNGGVKKQLTTQIFARYWLAAQRGNADAMKEVADMWFYGDRYFIREPKPGLKNPPGIDTNYIRALDMYEALARQGIEAPELEACRVKALEQRKELRKRAAWKMKQAAEHKSTK